MDKPRTFRQVLAAYYSMGGDQVPYGSFKARVLSGPKDGKILLKELYVLAVDPMCYDMDVGTIEGVEDHVFIYDVAEFISAGVKAGDCVSFSGVVYKYERRDHSIDYSIRECENVQVIEAQYLPDRRNLQERNDRRLISQLICETCLFTDHCDGLFCLMGDDERENQIKSMMKMLKEVRQQSVKLWVDAKQPAPVGYVWARTFDEAREEIEKHEAMIFLIDIGDDCSEMLDGSRLLDWIGKTDREFRFHLHGDDERCIRKLRKTIEKNHWTEV